jgi:hypothetical protein
MDRSGNEGPAPLRTVHFHKMSMWIVTAKMPSSFIRGGFASTLEQRTLAPGNAAASRLCLECRLHTSRMSPPLRVSGGWSYSVGYAFRTRHLQKRQNENLHV